MKVQIRIISIFLSCIFLPAFSQDAMSKYDSGEDVNVVYKYERTFHLMAHGNGFGLGFRKAKNITAKLKRQYEIEGLNMRHPKEIKSYNYQFQNTRGFFYGKTHSLFILRGGYGLQHVLYDKVERKNVEIRFNWYAGVSLALAKPIYYNIINSGQNNDADYITTEKFDINTHSTYNIYSRAAFGKGLNETKIIPGGYVKTGLCIDFAPDKQTAKSIEIGTVVDIYPTVIPLMATQKSNQVFLSFYIQFMFGKKWF